LTEATFIKSLSPNLTKDEPANLVRRKSAGVAVVIRHLDGEEEVLMIRRAEREGDPWSGEVAFPGGMVSPSDGSFEETARRETAEEVGIDLSEGATFLGYMREMNAGNKAVVVVPSVYRLDAPKAVALSGEVASYKWVPLRDLARAGARSTYRVRRGGMEIPFPALVHKDFVIWGLTERILSAIIPIPEKTGTGSSPGKAGR
jgi:8-oxo-dGTP pyrophosphatase MutT (NUDIX family)